MKISVEFNSFEEVVEFGRIISSGMVAEKHGSGNDSKKEPETVPDNPAPTVPYGKQIAESFPGANVSVVAPVNQPPVTASAPVTVPVQPAVVQTAQRTYTPDELASAAMQLMDKGLQVQLQELLAGFGVEALPMLPEEQYGAFATKLRGMGAQI